MYLPAIFQQRNARTNLNMCVVSNLIQLRVNYFSFQLSALFRNTRTLPS